jgi:hypothetical protein
MMSASEVRQRSSRTPRCLGPPRLASDLATHPELRRAQQHFLLYTAWVSSPPKCEARCWRKQENGSAQRTGSDRIEVLPNRRVAPENPFLCLPLCCGPNESHYNCHGLLTRRNHSHLRVTKVVRKFWMKICRCQVSRGPKETGTNRRRKTNIGYVTNL